MTEESLKGMYAKAKRTGHQKVAGEDSLTLGEIVFTILGILVILYGTKANIPKKFGLPLGLGIIFIGEWMF